MRTFSLGFYILLGACGGNTGGGAGIEADAPRLACMVDGGNAFESVCTIQQSAGEQGLILTISSPSGGFRRLLVTRDGRGVVTADGAEQASVTPLNGGLIEVAVGGDRYRLPAMVKPSGQSQ